MLLLLSFVRKIKPCKTLKEDLGPKLQDRGCRRHVACVGKLGLAESRALEKNVASGQNGKKCQEIMHLGESSGWRPGTGCLETTCCGQDEAAERLSAHEL